MNATPRDRQGDHRQLSAHDKRALLASLLKQRAAAAETTVALSNGQEALWLLHQRAPLSAAYNTAFAVRVRSAVDTAALRAALHAIVERHASLRTTFEAVDGAPVARIRAHGEGWLDVIDARGWSDPTLREHAAEDYRRPFDLERGPLLRTSLFTRASDDHLLVVALHHIVCDAWSIWMLMHELGVLYPALLEGRHAGLPPVTAQYPDYVAWQRRVLDGPEGERLWHYWRDALAGELPVLDLQLGRPRTTTPRLGGASHFFEFDRALTQRLLELGKAHGATLFMVLLAAFQTLLHRYSGQHDLIVGSPAAGRNHPDTAATIGYFANPLPLRADFRGDPSFAELLSRVRHTVLDALAHQDLPFPLLVERLQPRREPGRWPVFDVMFVLQRPPQSEQFASLLAGTGPSRIGGLDVEPFALPQMEGQFDLTWEVVEGRDSLPCVLKYDPELYDAQTVQRMEGHLRTLLDALADDPRQPVGRLPLLTPAERDQVLRAGRGPERAYPLERCLHHWIEDQVERSPDATAVLLAEGGARLTYRDLDRRANRLAHRLLRLGVGPGEVVGVLAERSLELVVGLLGILKSGGAYLPLDPDHPPRRLARMVSDAGARVLLTHGRVGGEANDVVEAASQVIHLEIGEAADADADADAADARRAASPVSADDLAYVIYTSGSTGEPKGVENTHRGICNRLLWMQDEYRLEPADRVLQKTPIGFDVSVWEFFWPLMTGATLVMGRPGGHRDRDALVHTIAVHGITTLHFVPSMLRQFLEARDLARCRATLRRVFCSGEALPFELQQRVFERLDVELHNLYGPTEAAVDVTHWRCRRDTALQTVPIGRPIANTRIHLLDRNGQPVPIGLPAQLHIGGVAVARGYRNRLDLTAEKFVPDPWADAPGARMYRTGDLCRWRPDGNIDYLGRIDTQVKLRGQRIELGEVQATLRAHPQVGDAAVDVERHGDDARLLAWFVPRNGTGGVPDATELRRFLRERLPEAMVPAAFVALEALPLTPNGKLDRAALPRRTAAPAQQPAAAGTSEIEHRIAAIWCSVLRIDTVGASHNFYDAGGHSLLLATVQTRLAEAFGRAPSMVEMFQFPTVRQLAAFYAGTPAAQATRAAPAAAARAQGDVAIIGMAGRFPGAADVGTFWRNLCAGVESIRVFDDAELAAAGVPPSQLADPRYVKAFGALDGVEMFDAAFFGFPPREAELMDVQHRLLLECAWAAIESAGHDPQAEQHRYGLYAGVGMNRYLLGHLLGQPGFADSLDASELYRLMIGNDKDFAPTRASYKLGLTGPSVSVQTACSTSLVAVHLACRSLLGGECDTALAGGCSVTLPQDRGYLHQEGMILSPDGHCRAFDADAGGTVGGNGVAIVVLKRLDDAIAEGDHVHAVIKGSALNNDGAAKAGYTAPSVAGQAAVIGAALAAAGIDPQTIGYIEAHGTATPLGDPIEVAALARAFRAAATRTDGTDRTGYCALGSVKTNVGHLDSAAGVAGLIKAALAVEHGVIPPSLHFHAPNPALDLSRTPFFVPTELQPWPTPDGVPRRAGVSSFGIGGTNAHVVLEQAAPADPGPARRTVHPLLLSARRPDALDAAAARLADHLRRQPQLELADVAYTLACGRRAFDHRRMLVCGSLDEAIAALEGGGATVDEVADAEPGTVAFMFPGQGAQHAGMARELYRTEPVFRDQLDGCADALRRHADLDLHGLLFSPSSNDEQLRQTAVAQPALFAVEYALARLWMSWGTQPQALIGHSLGEYVAACLAGVWSLDDALGLVALRGELMQRQPAGAMLAVSLAQDEVQSWIGDELALAAVNAPGLCVVSGPCGAVAALAERLAAQDIACRALATSHAFHSPMMAPVVEPLRARLRATACRAPSIPFVSNVTGTWIEPAQATDPDYWARHLMQPVRFADGLDALLAEAPRWLIEVGPGDTLCGLARRHPRRLASRIVASLRTAHDPRPEAAHLAEAAARVWLAGGPIDWGAFHAGQRRRRVPLPTYPFERRRHWIEVVRPDPGKATPGAQRGLDAWFHIASWQRTPPTPAAPGAGTHWLVLTDDCGLGTAIAARLDACGVRVTQVSAGAAFARRDASHYVVRAAERADHEAVLDALRAAAAPPPCVVLHLWNVTAESVDAVDGASRDRSYHSLVALAQALGGAADASPCHIAVVSNRLHDVAGDAPIEAAKALLLGPVTVIPQEYARLACTSLDIDLAPAHRERHVALLIADASLATSDLPIAYRGGYRWTQSFVPAPLPAAASAVRPEGAYLVAGGTGGVGLAMAEWLAGAAANVKLALLARGDAAPGDVERLERAGAQVLQVRADLADPAQLRVALAEVRQRFGALHGVIHAAGIPGGRVMALAGREDAEHQFEAKVDGTLHLDALLGSEALDFFIVCSSLTSTLGGAGQAAYAGACAFQDAWAQARAAQGACGRVVAIDWDRWDNVGMARGAQARFTELTGAELPAGMQAGEATEALGRVIAAMPALQARIVVSVRDPMAERARSCGFQLGSAGQRAQAATPPARPDGAGDYVEPEGDSQRLIADLWRREFGIDRVGAHDDFFMLGGDSLMAIRLTARLRQALAVPLDARVLYEAPSVSALAAHVAAMRWVAGERHEAAAHEEEGAL
ncbi:non-ribosomal peptide synthetase/type I polyketide synthase [Variovorax sp. J22R115]|uniref:non-ribosomal peptide synthetase/type I polyketide synthase n=1 Tax=Variovorax sp. J22R115 TaxID=3053509 RepID=UPI002577C91F|nr:non-ribosomal peptide synthetase/type I polyketide synthase [Variovorax sp. J22R115]MDM0053598.1 amino acid adenylation domain-containing protein [Variovorax sp. J22R115]